MKKPALFLVVLLASLYAVRAQVDVEVILGQEQFLTRETIPVAVKISNQSGQTLHFGKDDWLTFSVEGENGFVVVKSGETPVEHDFDLPTSKSVTQPADLAPYFAINKTGHYKVIANVTLKDWNARVSSTPKGFDVINGYKLWEKVFGVPPVSPDDRSPPEVRKYILQKATYLQHLRLYLRVTDTSESKVFRVRAVGPMTSFSKPLTVLDKKNRLNLLYEDTARTYTYNVFDPDGELVLRQTYYYTEDGPHLRVDDKTGDVFIAGGLRHVAADDVPVPVTAPASNAVPVVKPQAKAQ